MINKSQGTLTNTPQGTTLATENTDKAFFTTLDKPSIEESKYDFQVHCSPSLPLTCPDTAPQSMAQQE